MIVALTRVPLPSSIVAIVSPHAAAVRSALSLGDGAPGAFLPLTIDSSDTTLGLDGAPGRDRVLLRRVRALPARRRARGGPGGIGGGLCRVAPRDRAGRHGREGYLLALPDRVRGPAALRAVRQPQPFRDLGDHGAAAVPRIHRGPLRVEGRRAGSRLEPNPAGARDRSAHGLADGGLRHDARRRCCCRCRARARSRWASPPSSTVDRLPAAARSPHAAGGCWPRPLSWSCAGSPGPTSRLCARAWPARPQASRTASPSGARRCRSSVISG